MKCKFVQKQNKRQLNCVKNFESLSLYAVGVHQGWEAQLSNNNSIDNNNTQSTFLSPVQWR